MAIRNGSMSQHRVLMVKESILVSTATIYQSLFFDLCFQNGYICLVSPVQINMTKVCTQAGDIWYIVRSTCFPELFLLDFRNVQATMLYLCETEIKN